MDIQKVLLDNYKVVSAFKVPSGEEYEIYFDISIYEENGHTWYNVTEQYAGDIIFQARSLIVKLLNKMQYNDEFFHDPVKRILDEFERINRRGSSRDLYRGLKNAVKYVVIKDVLGYRSITPLLSDNNLEDISLSAPNNYVQVWHRKYNHYGWSTTNIFIDDSEVTKIVNRLAFRSGKAINLFNPMIEGVLPEKYRVVATWMSEISPRGSSFTIRKFKTKPYTIIELIKNNLMPVYIAAYLWLLVDLKKFLMIIGPSGVGKTTLMNSLLLLVPSSRRIISIEEVPELYLYEHQGWKPLTTRYDKDPSKEILNLLKFSLRERADYIILGESRGLEARLVFQGAATGHGCITTFHASSLKELHARLTSKPISLDNSMFKLLDTVVILGLTESEEGFTRKVLRLYKQIDGKWTKIYDYKIGNDEEWMSKILKYIDIDIRPGYYKRISFLNYLIRINSATPEEFLNRILLFHAGKYKFIEGKWVLKVDIKDDNRET